MPCVKRQRARAKGRAQGRKGTVGAKGKAKGKCVWGQEGWMGKGSSLIWKIPFLQEFWGRLKRDEHTCYKKEETEEKTRKRHGGWI